MRPHFVAQHVAQDTVLRIQLSPHAAHRVNRDCSLEDGPQLWHSERNQQAASLSEKSSARRASTFSHGILPGGLGVGYCTGVLSAGPVASCSQAVTTVVLEATT